MDLIVDDKPLRAHMGLHLIHNLVSENKNGLAALLPRMGRIVGGALEIAVGAILRLAKVHCSNNGRTAVDAEEQTYQDNMFEVRQLHWLPIVSLEHGLGELIKGVGVEEKHYCKK